MGITPMINVSWNSANENDLSFPIGMNMGKVVRFGATPVKLRFDIQYSTGRPDDSGRAGPADASGGEWNFRLQITPLVPSTYW